MKKFNPDHTVDKWKARWVAKGFKQKFGVDYDIVFAPTGRIESVRILLALASIHRLKVTKFDITTFFLTGEIDMDVYVQQPEGYEEVPIGATGSKDPNDYVCKLNRSLYGTKQAAALSNQRLTANLIKCGFRQSKSETQVFIKGDIHSAACILLLLFVDDGLCVYKGDRFYEDTVASLRKLYDMKFEKNPSSFLSIQIEYDQSSLRIHQTGYVEQILSKFNMANCNPSFTPISKSQIQNVPSLEVLMAEEGPEDYQGRTAIGMLGWLVQLTRPDLCYMFNWVCRHTQVANKSSQVFAIIKHCFRYLKGSKNVGLTYPISVAGQENKEIEITVLVDSDLAGTADKKSTTGYLIYINDRLVMYRTKKQSTVATSTCNAELNGIVEAAKATLWLRGLLFEDLGLPIRTPTNIYNDNLPAIKLCLNPVSHSATRHFAIKQATLREWVQRNHISIHHMSGECLAADLLTKALDRVRFSQLLPILLQPNAEQNSHNDQTTKAYPSNTMGDGPEQEGNNTTSPGGPSKFMDSLTGPQQTEVYKVIQSATSSEEKSPYIYEIEDAQILILCLKHTRATRFNVDHIQRSVNVETCLNCLEQAKVLNPGLHIVAQRMIADSKRNYHLVVIRHPINHPNGSVVMVNHVIGVLTKDQIFEAMSFNNPIQSCATCQGHDNEERKEQSEKSRRLHRRKPSGSLKKPRTCQEIKHHFRGAENEANNGLIFYNEKILPTKNQQTFEDPPRTANKFTEMMKNKVNMIERAHLVAKELYCNYVEFARTPNSEEKKLLAYWTVLNKIKDDTTSLREEGIESFIMEGVVNPLIKVLANGLTNNMKSIVRGDIVHSQPPFSAIQIPPNMRSQQVSSQSTSSVGSSISANSSVSNTVQRMEGHTLPIEALAIEESTTPEVPNVNNLHLPVAQLIHGRDEFPNNENVEMGSPVGSPFLNIGSPLIHGSDDVLAIDIGSPLPNPIV